MDRKRWRVTLSMQRGARKRARLQCGSGALVVAALVELRERARLVEGARVRGRLGFAVELRDARERVRVAEPRARGLQELRGEEVARRRARRGGEAQHALAVVRLQQRAHRAHAVARLHAARAPSVRDNQVNQSPVSSRDDGRVLHTRRDHAACRCTWAPAGARARGGPHLRVDLGGELEEPLLARGLGDAPQRVVPRLVAAAALRGGQLLRELLRDGHGVLFHERQRLVALAGACVAWVRFRGARQCPQRGAGGTRGVLGFACSKNTNGIMLRGVRLAPAEDKAAGKRSRSALVPTQHSAFAVPHGRNAMWTQN